MTHPTVDAFIEAMQALEESRDTTAIASLFSQDALIGNVVAYDELHGQAGARAFFQMYRDTFVRVRSVFRNVVGDHERAALEWQTEGINQHGQGVCYVGASILELRDGQITRFCAYFDPHALGRQLAQHPSPAEAVREAERLAAPESTSPEGVP